MDIQRADPELAPRLKQGAEAAKGYWGYEAAWVQQWGSLLTLTPGYIRANDVYVAVDDGSEIIGFYATTRHGDLGELDHLWVSPEWIGTGAGRAILPRAPASQSGRARRMVREADPRAVSF